MHDGILVRVVRGFHRGVPIWRAGIVACMDDTFLQFGGFSFQEPGTGNECWTSIRAGQGQVILALSRKSDGDIEVAFELHDAARLHAILGRAIAGS